MKVYQEEIYNLQMAVMAQQIDDSADYLTLLLDDEKTFKSRHPEIFSMRLNYAQNMVPWTEWLYSDRATDNCAFTVVVVVKMHRSEDVGMVQSWLEAVDKTDRKMRLKIVPIGSLTTNTQILWKLHRKEVKPEAALDGLEEDPQELENADLQRWIEQNSRLVPDLCKMADKGPVVSINGHIYGPFTTPVAVSDINIWLQAEWQRRTETLQVLRINFELERDSTALTQMTLFTGHLVTLMQRHAHLFTGKTVMDIPLDKVCHFEVENETALVQIKVLLSPFSVQAAKISAILLVLPHTVF
jgi:hypothetical protein